MQYLRFQLFMTSKFYQLALLVTLIAAVNSLPCLSNQYSDANNLCQPCRPNCATCASADNCNTCISNTYVVVSSGSSICQPCTIVQPGCVECLSNIACKICQNGHYLIGNQCLTCATSVPFCNNCSLDGTICLQCKFPYILSNNKCLSGTQNDILAGGNPNPIPPNANNTNTTVNPPTITLPNNTVVNAVYDNNGCNQFQIFAYGQCFRILSQCQFYLSSGYCSICNAGFIVNIYGTCSPNNTNLRCNTNQWLNTVTDTCENVSKTCDWYYPNNGSCFNCTTNYTFTNGVCVPNRQCTDREFFFKGGCVQVPRSCTTFTSEGVCTGCESGTFLNEGICTQSFSTVSVNYCTFPCHTCFRPRPTFCYSCSLGYQLVNARYGSCTSTAVIQP